MLKSYLCDVYTLKNVICLLENMYVFPCYIFGLKLDLYEWVPVLAYSSPGFNKIKSVVKE